jgi:hypothetical protein
MREALVSARARVSLVCLFVLVLITAANPSPAPSANELSQVKKLYVDSFGLDTGAIEIRAQIVRRLSKSHKIRVVPNLQDADAALKGTGRVWTIGHISVSPRSHGPSQATLQGFLSAEVVGQDNRTVWSYLVTPSGSSTLYSTTNTGTFILSNGFIRMGESSLAGVLQEFVLRKLTKTKQQAADPLGAVYAAADKRSDPVPPAKKP